MILYIHVHTPNFPNPKPTSEQVNVTVSNAAIRNIISIERMSCMMVAGRKIQLTGEYFTNFLKYILRVHVYIH